MNKPSSRILALDLMRGYLLCVIAIDHLHRFPSLLDAFTGQGKLWVSAAEGFFIISGLLVGILKHPAKKLWSRALRLYFWSVSLTLLFTWWGSYLDRQSLKSGIWTAPFGSVVLNSLVFRYVYGWADFLPYYVVFLLVSPLAVLALRRNRAWLIFIVSGLFWITRGTNAYFAWQILFFSGLAAGYYFDKVSSYLHKYHYLILPVTFISLCASVYYVFINNTSFPIFDKAALNVGRVFLSWLWFSGLYLIFRLFERHINLASGGLFKLLGYNSLFVYGLQAILLFLVTPFLPPEPHYWLNTLYATSVLLIIYLITLLRTRLNHF